MPEKFSPLGHNLTSKSMAPHPEIATAERRHRGSDHALVQHTRELDVIHDMCSDVSRNATALNNQDVMKMLDDLDELSSIGGTIPGEVCRNGTSSGPSSEVESLNTVGQPLVKEAKDDRLQGRSWTMGRWEAELPGSHPWYYAERVGGCVGDASHPNASTGIDGQDNIGANGCAGAVEPDEDKWSNVATAADSDVGVEERLVVATAN
jgi:hypothetical protein